MGRNRFLRQEIDRLPLSDGDWIEVKRELNNGDDKKMMVAGQMSPVMVEGKPIFPIDWEVYEIERDLIYLTDWSLHDEKDKPVKLDAAALRAMSAADFQELHDAITQHIFRVAAAKKALRETKIKDQQTTAGSTPSATTGVLSGDPTSQS